MGLSQPEGRIIFNTNEGNSGKVNVWDRNDYALIDQKTCRADRPRVYCVGSDNKKVKINEFREAISVLSNCHY